MKRRLPLLVLGCGLVAGCAAQSTAIPPAGPALRRTSAHPSAVIDSPRPVSPAASCPTSGRQPGGSHALVDYVDFVELGGRQYVAGLEPPVAPPAAGELGGVVGRVRCQLPSEDPPAGYLPREGDAARLSPGTEIRAVLGWPVGCRVAARHPDGTLVTYVAHTGSGPGGTACPAPCPAPG